MRPLRALGKHGMDLMQPMPYTAFQAMLDDFAPQGLAELPPGPAPLGARRHHHRPLPRGRPNIGSPMTQGIIFRHGGAIGRVPEDAMAAGNREAPTWRTRSPAGRRRRGG